MGTGHASPLYLDGASPVHRMAAQIKIVAALGIVLCVVATPREAFGAFAAYVVLLAVVAAGAAIPPRWLTSRLLIELPFVVLAIMLPFTAGGQRISVLGLPLSLAGLFAGWNIIAKGTLGLATSLLLAATTTPQDLLRGLRRLHIPELITTIMTLMFRYAGVVAGESRRMRLARISRGHDPRFLWQLAATARGLASLFVRSFERGERVHLAMVSRGWTGTMPDDGVRPAQWSRWVCGLTPVVVAAGVLGVALWTV